MPLIILLLPTENILLLPALSLNSLIALIALSLFPEMNNKNMANSMFSEQGFELLLIQMTLLAAAALGASFISLYKANKYIAMGVYNPKYESSYWVRFVVGLISGIILTQLIPLNIDEVAKGIVAGGKAAKNTGGLESADDLRYASVAITKICLALLGGFSANLVYNILNRLVETVQFLIVPDPPIDPELLNQQFRSKYNQKLLMFLRKVTADLTQIQQELLIKENQTQEKIHGTIGDYIQKVSKIDISIG